MRGGTTSIHRKRSRTRKDTSARGPRCTVRSFEMVRECVLLADAPGALVELCGVSILERLLRMLQRCGVRHATILSSTPDLIGKHLARPSWARLGLQTTVRQRKYDTAKIEEITE